MAAYHKERALQEYEHFRGDTEEAKVRAQLAFLHALCLDLSLNQHDEVAVGEEDIARNHCQHLLLALAHHGQDQTCSFDCSLVGAAMPQNA